MRAVKKTQRLWQHDQQQQEEEEKESLIDQSGTEQRGTATQLYLHSIIAEISGHKNNALHLARERESKMEKEKKESRKERNNRKEATATTTSQLVETGWESIRPGRAIHYNSFRHLVRLERLFHSYHYIYAVATGTQKDIGILNFWPSVHPYIYIYISMCERGRSWKKPWN